MKTHFLTAFMLFIAAVMLPSAVFGQQQALQEAPETVVENYRLTLKCEDNEGGDMVISSIVTEGSFAFQTLDPEFSMEGTLRRQDDASRLVDYRLTLRIRVSAEVSESDFLTKAVSVSSRVRLALDKPATIFDTKSRKFTLTLARID